MINSIDDVRRQTTTLLGLALLGPALLTSVASSAQAQVQCDDPNIVSSLPETCQTERISASGNQRPTIGWALGSARDHWQDQVLTKYGERYGRWSQAACAKQECVPASLGGFMRCTLTGFPCVTKPKLLPPPEFGLSRREIREMQRLLNQLVPKSRLRIDGRFGPKTAAALEHWQRKNDFAADGLPNQTNLQRLRQAG
jgi:hypothetical protein